MFSGGEPLVNFGRGHYKEQFCEIILNFDQWFICRLKISYLELWRPICSAERNHLSNFGRGYHEEFLPGALTALVFGGAKPFMQFW